jgi:ribosomal protein S18 acetylase RimI-like enzyme
VVAEVDRATWGRLSLLPRVVAPTGPAEAHALIATLLEAPEPGQVSAAVVGSTVVGLAVSGPGDARDGSRELLALGVAPEYRRQGLATALLGAHIAGGSSGSSSSSGSFAVVTLAERDVVDPLPRQLRASIARGLLERAGYRVEPAEADLRSIDPLAFRATRLART